MSDELGTWATLSCTETGEYMKVPRDLWDVFNLRMERIAVALDLVQDEGCELTKDQRIECFEAALSMLDQDVETLKEWFETGKRQ